MPKQLNEFAQTEQPDLGADNSLGHDTEIDNEGAMAKADLFKLARYSLKLHKQIHDEDQLEAWVQAKITKAADYIASVFHYLEYEMKFSEYGSKLENSDVYNESEKLEIKNKLMEAKEKLKALKVTQADVMEAKKAKKDYDGDGKVESGKDEYLGSKIAAAKKAGKMEESMGGEEVPCEHCNGTGHTLAPVKSWGPEAKAKAAAYNKKAKAYAAAAKRIDANKNGIPDDEEAGEQVAPAAKKPAAKKPAEKKEETKADESQGSSKHSYGQGIYENDEVKGAKKAKQQNKDQDKEVRDDDLDEAAKPDFLDMDKDGNKKEPMKKAIKDKKVKEGKDEGKPGKNFAKIAKKAGEKYGSKEAGERVAGAVKAKLAKAGKLEEGVMDTISNAAGDMFNTDASLERRSPQLQQLLAMRKKYPDGTDEARQLDARIKLLKDRLSIDGSEVAGQGGMPKPVVDPATFKQQNPNFKYEGAMNESSDLSRMKEFLTRLNG
jgi:hypothetical protein